MTNRVGYVVGEPVWETGARPCQILCEYLEQNIDRVYSSCKEYMRQKDKNIKNIVGVDEAGRGPLAGPVAVGVAIVSKNFDWNLLPGVTDSKQLSGKRRKVIFRQAKELRKKGELNFAVSMVSAKVIDEVGINRAIKLAMTRALRRLQLHPEECFVKLDGGLKAPSEFTQETIIKGDQKEKIIGLASICAKETRDAYMVRIAAQPQFALYDFATHKGYGTQRHRAAIGKRGLSEQHRKSYCSKIDKRVT